MCHNLNGEISRREREENVKILYLVFHETLQQQPHGNVSEVGSLNKYARKNKFPKGKGRGGAT